jgi:RNA polymerase sigma-70 factor (ECF subfamily)
MCPMSTTVHDDFQAVYRAELRLVRRWVRRFGVPSHDIDDVVQEVFLVLHRHWDEMKQIEPIATWLYGVTRRVCSNYRRSTARRRVDLLPTCDDRMFCAVPDPHNRSLDEALAVARAWARLRSVLEQLSPEQQAVFILVELDQMSSREIAVATRRSPNTVLSQLRLARQALQQQLPRALF